MTTKTCVNGPKLVLKVFCVKCPVILKTHYLKNNFNPPLHIIHRNLVISSLKLLASPAYSKNVCCLFCNTK